LVQSCPGNRGLTPPQILELTQWWVRGGGVVECNREDRENWRGEWDYYYWTVIDGIEDIPSGLFVEMRLLDPDPNDPVVILVNAHPATHPHW
jgi:hypothetical protein